ncbi:uncharacterized protein BDR25DRAFT_312057 [Lindgomyces ingoldianus]|uniref:Uncharacterized protein n=1 Tax=Lindgomyces ingoldianus TaxID=673940 RepID=A0ACB6R4X5_9PLEO|nr:uncharacterized protein BDR25DRAFT_312057 [Lindgomyces ingoldianus]KAF2473888.1 hypothetical protein BDR25DRAFT_312057 [Lindgomyces ingoldianus]
MADEQPAEESILALSDSSMTALITSAHFVSMTEPTESQTPTSLASALPSITHVVTSVRPAQSIQNIIAIDESMIPPQWRPRPLHSTGTAWYYGVEVMGGMLVGGILVVFIITWCQCWWVGNCFWNFDRRGMKKRKASWERY